MTTKQTADTLPTFADIWSGKRIKVKRAPAVNKLWPRKARKPKGKRK